ncbi:MAG: sigma-70 family RNA polymerase sigma factor [Actinomycetia bacterium]|nr:sigma-70 family RNA polymerase sigma factor [Actinomycetes bacterium]MCP4961221.1 sigma-70 family RNA polymerase sigma factor [Actinomycetes bacterium]
MQSVELTAAAREPQVEVPDGTLANEAGLIERARKGDANAFAAIYRHYLPQIHAFAYRRCGSRETAEDVTAVVFEKAYRNLGKFEPRGGGFGAWLFRIAANQMNDHHRRSARPSSDRGQVAMARLMTESEDPVDDVLRGERSEVVRSALDRIKPRYRKALSLRYLAGLTNEEAAAAMGVTRSTMAVLVHRSLKSLRRQLEIEGVAATEEVNP